MKFMRISVAALATLILFSCKKDDSTGVIGNWEATSIAIESCTDPSDNGTTNFTNGCFSESLLGQVLFESCITAVFTATTYTITTTIKALGIEDTDVDTGTYTINGSTIRLCKGSDCVDATLNGNQTQLTFSDTDPDDGCKTTTTLRKK
jgi:hypothetical protein